MRSFASGFSIANKLFDFVDVGPGKDRADRKITGEYPTRVPILDRRPLTGFRDGEVLPEQ